MTENRIVDYLDECTDREMPYCSQNAMPGEEEQEKSRSEQQNVHLDGDSNAGNIFKVIFELSKYTVLCAE